MIMEATAVLAMVTITIIIIIIIGAVIGIVAAEEVLSMMTIHWVVHAGIGRQME